MVRKLKFEDTPEGRQRFYMLYQGFITGGNNAGQKTMNTVRNESRILEKFEKISIVETKNDEQQTPTGFRTMLAGPQEVDLEQPEYELLKKYFESAPWTVSAATKVVNIFDWYSSIQLE